MISRVRATVAVPKVTAAKRSQSAFRLRMWSNVAERGDREDQAVVVSSENGSPDRFLKPVRSLLV